MTTQQRVLDRAMARIASVVVAHPRRVILVTLLPCLLCTAYVAFVPINLSFFGLLPKQEPAIARYLEINDRLRLGSQVLLLVEGTDDALDEHMDAVLDGIAQIPEVKWVSRDQEKQWLEQNAPYLVKRSMFQDWVRLATHPDDTKSASRLAKHIEDEQKNVQKVRLPGKQLVFIELKSDPLKTNFLRQTFFGELEKGTNLILSRYGLVGHFAGFAAISSQDTTATMNRIKWVTPLGLFVILMLLRTIERRLLHLSVIGLTMVLAAGAALGLVGLITGGITVIEAFYGVMIFGLGADFAFHIMVRLREEFAIHENFDQALIATLSGVGPGIVAGAMTTAGAFLILSLAPDPGAMHLGLSGGLGLTICLVLMLTFLPAVWVLLERRSPGLPPMNLKIPGLDLVARSGVLRWRLYLAFMLLFLVVAVVASTRFEMETDLSKIFNRDVPAVQNGNRIAKEFGTHTEPWVLEAKSLEEARRMTDEAQTLPGMGRVLSLATIFPEDMSERRAALQVALKDIEQQKATYQGLVPLMGDEEAEQLKQLVKVLSVLEEAAQREPPSLETLPRQLANQFVSEGGYFIYAYFDASTLDSNVIRNQRMAISQLDEKAISLGAIIEVMISTDKPWIKWVIGSIMCFVLLWLWIDARRMKFMILSMTPVALATVGTLGLLCFFDFRFTSLTMVTVPLIVGLGVDDGIHVVHRIRQLGGEQIARAAVSVGRAIVMTTVSTCAGFSGLLLSNHPGMEGMATVLLVGLPICLIASVLCIPAIAMALGLGHLPPEHPESSSPHPSTQTGDPP